jgi:hypothetical protein
MRHWGVRPRDGLDDIKKLHELKKSGSITEEELTVFAPDWFSNERSQPQELHRDIAKRGGIGVRAMPLVSDQ